MPSLSSIWGPSSGTEDAEGQMALTGQPELGVIFVPENKAMVDASLAALQRADAGPALALRPYVGARGEPERLRLAGGGHPALERRARHDDELRHRTDVSAQLGHSDTQQVRRRPHASRGDLVHADGTRPEPKFLGRSLSPSICPVVTASPRLRMAPWRRLRLASPVTSRPVPRAGGGTI